MKRKPSQNFEFERGDGKFKNLYHRDYMPSGIIKGIADPKKRKALYELRERLEKKERRAVKHGA